MSLRSPRRRRRADINLVPLIDVLTVLLFFFLVSMQFRSLTTLEVTLPEVRTAGSTERAEQVEITITRDGRLYLNDQLISLADLPKAVREVAAGQPRIPVLIQADEESPLRALTEVMDVCREAALTNIRLQSR